MTLVGVNQVKNSRNVTELKVKRGLFIAFEGIDGCGKSTQIQLLEDKLKKQGYELVRIREPGGTQSGEEIRNVILKPRPEGLDAITEVLLYSAARAQLMSEVVRPAIQAGKAVLADRFAWSTLAYQGFGRGLPIDKIEGLIELAIGETWPDKTFILDLTVEESRKRQDSRGQALDRLELEKNEFFEKVRQGYLHVANKYQDKVECLQAVDTVENIHKQIMTQVKELL